MNKHKKFSINESGTEHKLIDSLTLDSKHVKSEQTRLLPSHRLLIAFLLGLSSFAFYAQRQSLNMTILCMVDHAGLKNRTPIHQNHSSVCRVSASSSINDEEDDDIVNGPYLWDKRIQSFILGAFYWGYVLQIFGGVITGKFGSKKVLTTAVFVSSVATILIPLGAKLHYTVIIALRFFAGVAQGFMYPSCLPLISKWTPIHERGKLTSFLAAGSSLGIILATAITGPMCQAGVWYLNYVILSIVGFVWLIVWIYFGTNTPSESRHIKAEELAYIEANTEKTDDTKAKSIRDWPIKSILTSRSVWAIIATNVLSDFTLYGIFSVFPLYLWEVFNLSVVANSYINSGEFIFMWVCTVVAAFCSDHFIKKKILSRLNTRKLFNSIGMILPAILFPIIGFMSCDQFGFVVALLVLGAGFQGTFINAGYLLNAVDVAGPYSGAVIGISNSLGSFSGILAPLVGNALTEHRTMMEWRTCFLVFSGVLLVAGLVFLLFSKADLEPWAVSNEPEKELKEDLKPLANRKPPQPKLERQFSLDSRNNNLVPSNSTDTNDDDNVPYLHYVSNNNPVILIKPSKPINNRNTQNL